MNKTTLIIALAAAAIGFTACEDDKKPVYHEPTQFVLNTPALAGQYYELYTGGTVELTCTQPDYGFAAEANYTVDVALDNKFEEGSYANIKGKPANSAQILLDDETLCKELLKLKGITSYGDYPEEGLAPVEVFFRAHCSLSGVESSAITSNTISLKTVGLYNPFSMGGRTIYLVGAPQGWDINSNACALNETGVNTDIYVGAFEIAPGEQYFRFYQTLGDWGNDNELPSIGANGADGTNTEVTITDEPLTVPAVPGKGSWYTSASWKGGYVTFTVDLRDMDAMTVTIQAGNHDTIGKSFIYLVGACSAWSVADANAEDIYANYKLFDMEDNGVFTGTFNVANGSAMFRFYTVLGDWDQGSLGYQVADEATDLTMSDGKFSGPFVEGKGSWSFPAWPGGMMKMTVNTNDNTVLFETAE